MPRTYSFRSASASRISASRTRGAARAARARRPTRWRGRWRRARGARRRARPRRARGASSRGVAAPRRRTWAALPSELLGERERRHPLRHAVEHARAGALLGGLRRVPVHEHLFGRRRDRVAEDVRMPPHHLLGQPAGDVVDAERRLAVARGDLGVEQHLPEQIAELFAEVFAGALLDGVDELGALFDEIRHERPMVDLLRPHAAVAHGAHRVGRLAQRIGHACTSSVSSTRVPAMRWWRRRHVTMSAASTAAMREPLTTPRIASSRISGVPSNARSERSSETVKPMPPSAPTASRSPSGSFGWSGRRRTASGRASPRRRCRRACRPAGRTRCPRRRARGRSRPTGSARGRR